MLKSLKQKVVFGSLDELKYFNCVNITIRTSKHRLSISCEGVTNKLSCQFDAAKNVAFSRNNNNICYLVAILFATHVKKRKFVR